MNTFKMISMIFFGAFFLTGTALADVVVVVGANSGVTTISTGDAKNIFLGKSDKLADGTAAVPVYQAESSAAHGAFRDTVLGKNASQLKAYWSQLVFSGKGNPPKEVDNSATVKAHVASTPGGIGYIDASEVDGSVKVLLTVK